jgi:hypothetical protein
MAKPKRKQKLKVFSTPIGFHDALVAAPSQKAALEAWGSDSNLFSQGSAHVVTDPKLAKLPLEHPGQVVKVLRGSEAEQLAALAEQKPRTSGKAHKAEVLPKKRSPKPSRAALDRAESAVEKLQEKQAADRDKLDEQVRSLERRRRDLVRRQERQRDEAQSRAEDEREKYNSAVRRYESG